MSILRDLKTLVLPPLCPICGAPMHEGEGELCVLCRVTAPLTSFYEQAANPLSDRLRDQFPFRHACALLWFIPGSPWQKAIHSFKYRARYRTAYLLGRWLGREMLQGGLYGSVDVVVPVPLHPLRLLRRGYNQSEYIARGISKELSIPVYPRALKRLRNNPSQTTRRDEQRWENVDRLFAVRRDLSGKHILLVDDVVTTGSTLISCAETLDRNLTDVRISIAALAASQARFGLARR